TLPLASRVGAYRATPGAVRIPQLILVFERGPLVPKQRRGLLARLFRGAELGSPTHTSFGRIIPSSDIDPSPIRGARDALSQYSGWVFAAASFIAEEASALEWDLWVRSGRDKSEWDLDEAHELNDILARPNSSATWGQFLEVTDLHFSLAGQAFW